MEESPQSSDSGFEVHEVIFAESLGVNLQEEFALELLDIAARALYILPEGWEVDFAESELGTIPFFYDTKTEQSHWIHPYAQDLKMLIEEKRLELLREEDVFNEEDEIDESEYFEDAEDASTIRVNESSEIEALPKRIKFEFDGVPEEKETTEDEEVNAKEDSEEKTQNSEALVADTINETAEELKQVQIDSVSADKEGESVISGDQVAESQKAEMIPSDSALILTEGVGKPAGIEFSPSEVVVDAVDAATVLPVETTNIVEAVSSEVVEETSDSQPGTTVETNPDAVDESKTELVADLDVNPAVNDAVGIQSNADEAVVDSLKSETERAVIHDSQLDEPVSKVVTEGIPSVDETAVPDPSVVMTAAKEKEEEEKVVVVVESMASQVTDVAASASIAELLVSVTEEVVAEHIARDRTMDTVSKAIASSMVDDATSGMLSAVVPVAVAEVEADDAKDKKEKEEREKAAQEAARKLQEENDETAAAVTAAVTIVLPTTDDGKDEQQQNVATATEEVSPPSPSSKVTTAAAETSETSETSTIKETITTAEEERAVADHTPEKAKETTAVSASPKSVHPLPADPFADFFTIDPALHTFIDTLEKKKKKKALLAAKQQKQTKAHGKTTATTIDDDVVASSMDLDEILRQRRQTERAKEADARRKQEELKAAEEKKKKETEEQLAKIQKEKEEKEKKQKEADELAAALRKKQEEEEKEAAEALLIIVPPAVSAPSPPGLHQQSTAATLASTLDMQTTAAGPSSSSSSSSSFDDGLFERGDIVAKESIPEQDQQDEETTMRKTSDRWGLASTPLTPVPLDKSIDIMDHFRNIYSAPSTADPSSAAAGQVSQVPSNRLLTKQGSARHIPRAMSSSTLKPSTVTTSASASSFNHEDASWIMMTLSGQDEEEVGGGGERGVHDMQQQYKQRGVLDTTKFVYRDPSKRKKKTKNAFASPSQQQLQQNDNTNTASPTTSSPPPLKLKPHATSADGWVILAAYANYKEAERAVALFEALAPTKSIAGQSFPSHSKFLPPVKATGGGNTQQYENHSSSSFAAGDRDDEHGVNASPLKKKSLLFSNAPITKESILLSTQQELPQVRIARDLGRMQWIVECNDASMKKVFERRIAKRLRTGQGAEKLLAHLSPAKQQMLGLDESTTTGGGGVSSSSHSGSSPKREHDGNGHGANRGTKKNSSSPLKQMTNSKYTAAFIPQALISNKNTKHVSGQMSVQYQLPRTSYEEKQKGQRKQQNTLSLSLSSIDGVAQSSTKHNDDGHHGSIHSNNNNSKSSSAHRGPLTFRAALQDGSESAKLKKSSMRPASTHT